MILNRDFFLKGYPCIYFLYDKDEVVYIGKTTRPTDRFMAHAKSDKIFDSIQIKQCELSEMDYIEKMEIFNHMPKYNKRILLGGN